MRRVPFHRHILLAAFIASAFFLAGCLESDRTVLIRYDRDKDEWSFLHVYENIRSATQQGRDRPEDDLQRLQSLWVDRHHLVLRVIPVFSFNIFGGGESAILRLGDHEIANVDLGSASVGERTPTSVPYDTIRIVPGVLFLRGKSNLCYFHQMVVPGATADAAIAEYNAQQHAERAEKDWKDIDEELAARKAGATPPTFGEFASVLIDLADGKEHQARDHFIPLSDESLTQIRDAMRAGKISIARRKSEFFMRLPMSQADVAEIVQLIQPTRKALLDKLATRPATQPDERMQSDLLRFAIDAASVRAIDKTTVEIAFDVGTFYARMLALPNLRLAGPEDLPDTGAKGSATQAVGLATLAAEKLPVRRDIKLETIIADFTSGKLTVLDTEKPGPPGRGLEIPPAPTTRPDTPAAPAGDQER